MVLKDLFYFKDMYSKKEVVELFKDFEETNYQFRYIDECVDAFLEERGLIEEKEDPIEVIINGETYIKK